MKKDKIELKLFRVESFVTTFKDREGNAVKGGGCTLGCQTSDTIETACSQGQTQLKEGAYFC
ncbi:MAG: pinensin family lanthipeptide [Cyclobacteriaceae bacterium]